METLMDVTMAAETLFVIKLAGFVGVIGLMYELARDDSDTWPSA